MVGGVGLVGAGGLVGEEDASGGVGPLAVAGWSGEFVAVVGALSVVVGAEGPEVGGGAGAAVGEGFVVVEFDPGVGASGYGAGVFDQFEGGADVGGDVAAVVGDCFDVGAGFEEVGRERVTEGVSGDSLVEACGG